MIHFTGKDIRFMKEALELAKDAGMLGEAPVGAVVVYGGDVVARDHNRIELNQDPTAHAEILVLRSAAQALGNWRLLGATVYVTIEPCVMCAAALIHARVSRLVFGAWDPRWGGMGSLFDFAHDPRLNHEIEVISGVMREESASLMQDFFDRRRKNRFRPN